MIIKIKNVFIENGYFDFFKINTLVKKLADSFVLDQKIEFDFLYVNLVLPKDIPVLLKIINKDYYNNLEFISLCENDSIFLWIDPITIEVLSSHNLIESSNASHHSQMRIIEIIFTEILNYYNVLKLKDIINYNFELWKNDLVFGKTSLIKQK